MRFTPFFFIGFVILAVLALVKSKHAASSEKITSEDFWTKESKANTTRKKELTDLDYILFDYKNLPIIENNDTGISRCLSVLFKLNGTPMLNLHGKTNTDLKLEYGYNNLRYLMDCEANYLKLIQVLHQLGKKLQDLGLLKEATQIFELEINYESDIKETYATLGLIYVESGRLEKLADLTSKAQLLDPIKRDTIVELLNSYL